MRTLIPLTLLLTLLVSCRAGYPPQPEEIPEPEPSPSTPAAELTPSPTPKPAPTPYDYAAPVPEREPVDGSWFDDAVFIGDSRTDGLRLYGGLTGGDFLCYKGLTVFEVMDDKPVIQTSGGKVGVLQALEQEQYAKIYLMLGINELGYNYDQGFKDTYCAVVDQLREAQPDADIYLQSLIPVNTETCAETGQPGYVNNEKIAVYNEIIESIALEKEIYYVNVQEALIDETGELPAEASSDGIHFHKEGYVTWYEYLQTHTVEEETP